MEPTTLRSLSAEARTGHSNTWPCWKAGHSLEKPTKMHVPTEETLTLHFINVDTLIIVDTLVSSCKLPELPFPASHETAPFINNIPVSALRFRVGSAPPFCLFVGCFGFCVCGVFVLIKDDVYTMQYSGKQFALGTFFFTVPSRPGNDLTSPFSLLPRRFVFPHNSFSGHEILASEGPRLL